MTYDLIKMLKAHEKDEKLGPTIAKALEFARNSNAKNWQSPSTGQSSFGVANTYRIRMKNKKFRKEAFSGMEESISLLAERDVKVYLSVIETDQAIISVWLASEEGPPVGLVIGTLLSTEKAGQ
jgi:hypothetical protein